MILLGCLGVFVFTLKTVPFQSLEENKSWRHPGQNTVGSTNPPTQFLGKDNDRITLSCELRPEVTGGDISLEVLDKMANTGYAWPLIMGTGKLMGSYVIENISTTRKDMMNDSKARSISFTMSLKKVSDQPFGLAGEALGLSIGIVRSLTGV